jgi:hypothetical protein
MNSLLALLAALSPEAVQRTKEQQELLALRWFGNRWSGNVIVFQIRDHHCVRQSLTMAHSPTSHQQGHCPALRKCLLLRILLFVTLALLLLFIQLVLVSACLRDVQRN